MKTRLEVYRNVGGGFFSLPQSMRKGGNSSGQITEVPAGVGGGLGFVLGINLACHHLFA